ncbi:S41 family peptidase [Photobacterium damselae]|uniref:S41 family peptidase n=1 Tax=Photobacterium damselae TaxID=38293 RepID=UPI0040690036
MKRKFLSALFILAALTSTANAENTVINSSSLLAKNGTQIKLDPVMSVTAELSFYHYPALSFSDLKHHIIKSFIKSEKHFGAKDKTLLVSLHNSLSQADSIDEILKIENLLEQEIKTKTKLNTDEINKVIIKNILSLREDPYTRLELTKQSQNNQSKPPASVTTRANGDMIITSFSANKCMLNNSMVRNGMTVDVTNNGGGTIQCALEALGAFLPRGKHLVGTLVTNDFTKKLFVIGAQTTPTTGVVKVNSNTASSAEFFAGVLSKNGWKIRGGKTFGKVVTQYQFQSKYGVYYITIGHYKIL